MPLNMGMSYQSPLGRLPIKKKKNQKDPPVKIPEAIKLPDGRIIPLADLKTNPKREFINLQTKKTANRAASVCKGPKYTLQDHIWISLATPEDVISRYKIRKAYAGTFIKRSQDIVKRLTSGTEDHIIVVNGDLSNV